MTARGLVVVALSFLLAAGCRERAPEPTGDPASRRTTPSGDVVGTIGRYGSHVWRGLPYAAPPVGARRWRAPAPPPAWSGVRESLRAGSPCVQYASPLGGIQTTPTNTPVGAEDCLYVDVYAPRGATPTSFLPVMVWIHGGGNTIGAGSLYDGGNLAATENVVVVTVNHRLGPFGYLRHAALRAGAADDAERSGNFATLDLIRALEWVESHAAAFGGDPARVTIFGESAGATNAMALLLSPHAVGLFHRAILQSGGLRMRDPAVAEAFTETPDDETRNSSNEAIARLLVAKGLARDRADAKAKIETMPAASLADELRRMEAYAVLRAYEPLPGIGMIAMPVVLQDGAVLPAGSLVDRLRRPDGWNRVPVVVGTNRDEAKLFMFGSPQWVTRWLWVVPRLREPERYDAVAEHMSRVWKATGADEVADAMVRSGASDVYVYRFDWDEEPTIVGADLSRMLGAAHGFEIPFVFGHFDLGREGNQIFTAENEPGRKELAAAMMAYWAAFARSGNPAPDRGPAWPAWTATDPRFVVLDTAAGGGIRTSGETVTRDAALAAIATDPRLPTPRDRCLVYHDLVVPAGQIERSEFDRLCPRHPFDAFPWRD
jgi:para-nitrobenzyl esterase